MSDEQERSGWNRREALRWLLGIPIPLGLLSAEALAQLTAPRNLRIPPQAAAADSPIARKVYPRTFLSPSTLTALRSQLARDAAFRERWQTAISQFETGAGTNHGEPRH